jgi:hypothetical protein
MAASWLLRARVPPATNTGVHLSMSCAAASACLHVRTNAMKMYHLLLIICRGYCTGKGWDEQQGVCL